MALLRNIIRCRVAPQRICHVRLILLPGGHGGEELPCYAVYADKAFRDLSCDPPAPKFWDLTFRATPFTPSYSAFAMVHLIAH